MLCVVNRSALLTIVIMTLLTAACTFSETLGSGNQQNSRRASARSSVHSSEIAPGTYRGMLDVPGMQLEMTIYLEQDPDGSWSGKIDIPQQMTIGYPLIDVAIDGPKLAMALDSPAGRAEFSGTYEGASGLISGEMSQSGVSFPFQLAVFDAEAIAAAATDRLSDLPEDIERIMADTHVPGMAIGVVVSGQLVHSKGYGLRNLEENLPVTPQTMFSIGSVSKSFTATAIGILADEGLVDWDAPAVEYLPEFALSDEIATTVVTARDLCTHRTGLPPNDLEGVGWSDHYTSRDEAMAKMRAIELTADVRTLFQYSNLGFTAAGVLAGRVDGSSWEDVIQRRLLAPLGMDNTVFTYEEMEQMADHATGYDWRWGTDVEVPYFEALPMNYDVVNLGPSGSIQSNLEDMLKYLRLHLGSGVVDGKQVVSLEQLAMMHSPHIPITGVHGQVPQIPMMDYGLGWMIYPYRGYYCVEHGGSIGGYSCVVCMLPDEEIGVVVLTNVQQSKVPMAVALYVCDLLLELDPEQGSLALLKLLMVGEEMQSKQKCC